MRPVDPAGDLRRATGGYPLGRPVGMPGNKPALMRPRPEGTELRKRRTHGFTRRRMNPTRQVVPALDSCPECATRMTGGWVHRTREIVEIPCATHSQRTRWCLRPSSAGVWSSSSKVCSVLDYGDLFVFVSRPSMPSKNNAAEWSLRHLVISRKVSGDTRSEQGNNR